MTQIPTDRHSTNYLTSAPQKCQDHQKQGKSEKLSQPRGAKGDMTTKCNELSGNKKEKGC